MCRWDVFQVNVRNISSQSSFVLNIVIRTKTTLPRMIRLFVFRAWSSSWMQVTRSDLTKLGGNWQVGFEIKTNIKENTRTKTNTNVKENTRTKTKKNTRTGQDTWRASALV